MNMFKESSMNKLESVPIEVAQYIKMCEELDINLYDSNIDVTEYQKESNYKIVENYANIAIEEKNSLCDKSIQISYIKNISYDDFFKEGIEIIKDFIETIEYSRDQYNYSKNYNEIIREHIKKNNCEHTNENVLKALREIALKLYNEEYFNESMRELYSEEFEEFEEFNECYNKINENNLNVAVALHTSNIDVVYSNNSIKGGIFIENAGMIYFEADIDENKTINTIKVYVYESVSDITYEAGSVIDYKDSFVKWLEYEDVKPIKSEVIDFNELLKEYNLSELSQNPIVAIYKLKDVIISKTLENNNTKKSI